MSALDTVASDVVASADEAVTDARAQLPLPPPARAGIPATRNLSITLYALLALVGGTVAAGLLMGGGVGATVAFAAAASLLAVAAATSRVITTLTPATLRPGLIRRRRPMRVAVAGAHASALDLRAELQEAGVGGVEVVGAVDPDEVWRVVEGEAIDLLLIGRGVSPARVADAVLRTCADAPVRVCELSAFYEEVLGRVPIVETDSAWLQYVLHPRFRDRRSQRIADVVVAGALAVGLLPLLGVLVLLVRRDGGPPLFRQRRVGRDGRPFVIYKFRTMRWEGTSEAALWAEDGDPRITTIGRFLRRTHLDELPQLANVLRGDMTLVGPRPEQPEIAARLDEALPLWRGRHRYKPGLTGWAQVNCGYSGSADGSAIKLAHDLYYLRRQSLALDVAILAQTALMVPLARWYTQEAATPFVVRASRGTGSVDSGRSPAEDDDATPMRALVTGGAGSIGSQLVERLVEDGLHVVAVDDRSSGRLENLRRALAGGARLEIADVACADEMERIFAAVRPQVVFHLAAPNILGTLAVLGATRACGARRFVLASSAGDAAAAAAAEQHTALHGRLYGFSTTTLRLANADGATIEGGVIAALLAAGRSSDSGAPNIGTATETTVIRDLDVRGWSPSISLADGLAETLSRARAIIRGRDRAGLQDVSKRPMQDPCPPAASPLPPSSSSSSSPRRPRPQQGRPREPSVPPHQTPTAA
jgi:lipopolysaccharide/colanic/teichoic acid biosynthesis glycosyltransferase